MTALATDLAAVAAMVALAQKAAAAGQNVDLGDLGRRVDQLCNTLVAMPRQQAKRYVAELQQLIGELNRLRDAIVAGQADEDAQVDPVR